MLNILLTTPISKKSRSAPKGCYPMQNTSALLFPLIKTETPAFMEGSRMEICKALRVRAKGAY